MLASGLALAAGASAADSATGSVANAAPNVASVASVASSAASSPASNAISEPGLRAAFESPCPGNGGPCITITDATGTILKRLRAASLDGRARARFAELHRVSARRSIVVAFAGLPELWEISLDPAAPPIFDGLVHDHRMGEAIGRPGYLAPRRTLLAVPIGALAIDAESGWVIGRERERERAGEREREGGPDAAQVVLLNLDIRRVVARWPAAPGLDTAAAKPAARDGRRGFLVPAGGGALLWFEPPR